MLKGTYISLLCLILICLSHHCCAGAVEAISFLVSSFKGKIHSKSKTLIITCIKTMLRLTTSTQALSIFTDVLHELVFTHVGSESFGGKGYNKEYEVWHYLTH